jgi:hypothetical protein
VSYLTSIRTGVEALVLGTAGTSFVLTQGRFALRDAGRTLDTCDLASGERRVEVVVRTGRPVLPVNMCDGAALFDHALLVRVAYLRTDAGGDEAEAIAGELDGPGTLDAIADRAATDAHDLACVLGWYENWSFANAPSVVDLARTEADSTLTVSPQRCVLEVPFLLRCWASLTPGTYAP